MKELLIKLRKKNIHLSLDKDGLNIKFNEPSLPETLLDEIRKNKDDIVKYLKSVISNGTDYRPIDKVEPAHSFPLSSSQRRLWVLSQFEEANLAYNMPGVYVFEGILNLNSLEKSFDWLIGRHEILRTVFGLDSKGEIRQYIKGVKELGFKIELHDLRKVERREDEVRELVRQDFGRQFELGRGPLLRASLYQVEDERWIFSYVMHHIISDGWSMGILIKDLLRYYAGHVEGRELEDAALGIQYKDYAVWQQGELKEERLNPHKEYWLGHLSGDLPVLDLPKDKMRPLIKTYKGSSVNGIINSKTSQGLKRQMDEQGCSLYMGLLSGVFALLHRYSGQEDIIVGTPTAGRDHPDLEDQIGFYINTLVLRTPVRGNESFRTLIGSVKQITLEAFTHQVYPFDELVNDLNVSRDTSRSAMFDVMVILQNVSGINRMNEQRPPENLKIKDYRDYENNSSKFDLTFEFVDGLEGIQVRIEYNSDLYERATVERMRIHFDRLLENLVEQADRAIGEVDYLSEQEKYQLLDEFNDTAIEYEKGKTIVDLFEEHSERTPEQVAVVFESTALTYGALNERSNRFANYLRKQYKIGADDLVGIKLRRSERLIISILGVLKSGGTYLPIDPEYPPERIRYMMEDSQCRMMLDEVEWENFGREEPTFSAENIEKITNPEDLAYVMYTSGSTGRPKGVMIEHRSLVNRLMWATGFYGLTRVDAMLQKASFCFDASVMEILCPLLSGSKLVLAREGANMNWQYLKDAISSNNVSTIVFVPSLLEHFLHTLKLTEGQSLRTVLCGGEDLKPSLVKLLKQKLPKANLHNVYGPTEATIDVMCWSATNEVERKVTIGKPGPNNRIYVLDRRLGLCPIGVTGELCISGVQLARGYLNRPELTSEKFVAHPFRKGEKMYRTGDLGRWLADGNIEFSGRKDDQVKIRGYRIELGEIESALLGHQEIESAVVVSRSTGEGELDLVAYLVCKRDLNAVEIRTYLEKNLPAYMVPGYYVELKEIPLTVNGKVDRKRLPGLEGKSMDTGVGYVAPRNQQEERLVKIWQEVLSREGVGVRDNFFNLGGHSLRAIKLQSLLNKEPSFNIRIQDIYNYPTIEKMLLRRSENSNMLILNKVNSKGNKNIYFVPPVFGTSILFKPLAEKLENKFNCYGFQYRGLQQGEELFASIEEAAKEFCEKIVTQQEHDEFVLFGYSMGAIVAFEMTRILESTYKPIVVIVDVNPKSTRFNSRDNREIKKQTEFLFSAYQRLIPDSGIDEMQLRNFLSNNVRIQSVHELKNKIKSNICAFEAANNKYRTDTNLWAKYTEGNLTVEFLSGDHWEALSEINLPIYQRSINSLFQL